jgi:hypothetical protein
VAAILNLEIQNSTDATRGQPLAARILARKDELEDALANAGPRELLLRQSIETALATVYALVTGDLAHPSEVVARDLNRWLERHKHLAQEQTPRRRG